MKSQLITKSGDKKGTIELPSLFDTPLRQDIIQKVFEALKLNSRHPYSPSPVAGRQSTASGNVRHKRHAWRAHYGKGISRVPRKTMSRSGTQFNWIAAEVSGTRKGRKAHAPVLISHIRKINKKEFEQAFNIALASTADISKVKERYSTINNIKEVPYILEEIPQKTKELILLLKKLFAENMHLIVRNKTQRAGKGKSRGRRYKSNAGLLLVISPSEKVKCSLIEVKNTDDLEISSLYPLGRLTIFTKKALDELENEK
jgi:large subunit ribosomal protein L4e